MRQLAESRTPEWEELNQTFSYAIVGLRSLLDREIRDGFALSAAQTASWVFNVARTYHKVLGLDFPEVSE